MNNDEGQPLPADQGDVAQRIGAALGRSYSLVRELGAGGMATVYLARDLKHERDVAIKVLHPDLAAALGAERFLTEIRTTANLQHPHILPLHDSGEAGGFLFYVMPFVDGETLRTRLTRTRLLPIPEALLIAREVADALAYAHGRGVIHRDIKPENILLQGGHALVADFGIALAVQSAGGARMTQTGLSLGTPQYMTPEQAMGERAIDARTDVYALGAVTYEMLTGDPPFTGSTVQAIVARVLTDRPAPIRTTRDTVPAHVEAAVMTALAKLPADRFATAAEFAAALLAPPVTGDGVVAQQRRTRVAGRRARDPVVLGLGALVLVLAAAVAIVGRKVSLVAEPFPLRLEMVTAEVRIGGSAALSPDGHSLVFAGSSPSGLGPMLFVRRLDQLVSRPIAGTENATTPIFSPDGKWIAYIANRRRLMKAPLDDGVAVMLADIDDNGGLDWSTGNELVVGPGVTEGLKGLLHMPATGGSLVPLTRIDTTRHELSHQWPRVLADGATVLFTIWHGTVDDAELGATSLEHGKVTQLGVRGTQVVGVVDGQLIFIQADGRAMAVPFDARRLRTSGVAIPVLDSLRMQSAGGGTGTLNVSLTQAGGLVYGRGSAQRQLVWVDRAGAVTPVLKDRREFQSLRLSPDGRRAAVGIITGTRGDLWVVDLASGTLTPVTGSGRVRNPVWSPDGRRLLFSSTQGGRAALWWQPADGSGAAVKAGDPLHNQWNIDLAPDGHTVVMNALYDGSFNIETFSLDSLHARRELAASPTATESNARFSPDGRSLAYQSDESGRYEIYIRSFPEDGDRLLVSAAGGRRPVWAPDGTRIHYWEGTRMMVATLTRDPALRVVKRDALFDGRYELDYDVSRDGTRFLMIQSEAVGVRLVVVPDWLTELRRLTSAAKTP